MKAMPAVTPRPPFFNRRSTLASIHAAAAQLGLDTGDKDPGSAYRTIVRVQGAEGVSSAAELSDAGLQRVAKYLRRQAQGDGTMAYKIHRLWTALGKAGKLRDPSQEGLRAFLLARYKVASAKWLTAAQASHVIEALKAWSARGSQGE
jgi:phage gp16-like protein